MKPKLCPLTEKDRQGAALLCSVAALALLSFLAISFARLSLVSQQIASHHSEKIQSDLFAEAGLQRAILAIHQEYTLRGFSDWNNTSWVYKGEQNKLLAEVTNSDLSFYYRMTVAGRQLSYRVRVLDANSFLNINEMDQSGLQRMLVNLFGYLGIGADIAAAEKLAQHIIDHRPTISWDPVKEEIRGGYRSLDHLYLRLCQTGSDLNASEFQRLAPFLTCYAWANPRAFKRDTGKEDRIDATTRAPLNLNLAPWQLLAAAISGIRADDATEITPALAQKGGREIGRKTPDYRF